MTAPQTALALPRTTTGPILDIAFDCLRSGAPSPGELIDLPCGTGYLSCRALEAGWKVVPGDIDPSCWQGGDRATVKAIDLNAALPLATASADAIVCCEGMEHIENPWLVLREFHRLLRPGGQLIVSIPNTIDLRQRFRMFFRGHWNHYFPGVMGHINHMGPFVLVHAMRLTGFAVRDVRPSRVYGGVFLRLLARLFAFGKRSGLDADERRLLSAPEVLCCRTVVVRVERLAAPAPQGV